MCFPYFFKGNTIKLPVDSLRALIKVYKVSLKVQQTLNVGAIELSEDGIEVWNESLDWPDLGIDYFDLTTAIDQANTTIAQLEAVITSVSGDKSASCC